MKRIQNLLSFFLSILLFILISSCKSEFIGDDYSAYFGGEIINPTSKYVLFCKNNKVIDSIPLKENNTFFIKFDSLTPGLYSFKNNPEYQYLYFEKNDSLMVNVDTKNFDETLNYSGRGGEKNNFLIDMYLKSEKDKNSLFEVFNYDFDKFNSISNKIYSTNLAEYEAKKEENSWSDEFDIYAKAAIDLPYYTVKEIYPYIHKMRTGKDVYEKLPKDYYEFRNDIDFNNAAFTDYAPYIAYLGHMLNNMSEIKYHNHFSSADAALRTNINKLNITDSIIKNEKTKNLILNNIAFNYLLEDQNMTNNNLFLDTYHKYSTDKSQKNEIVKIGNAIQLLKPTFDLPRVNLIDINGKKISSSDLITKNTVFFFWSSEAKSHLIEAHKKAIAFQSKYPNFNFIAINLDDKTQVWKETLSNYNFKNVQEYHCANFDDLQAKWAITKVYRTIITDKDKKIINAFTGMFDANFEKNLK